MKTANSVLIGAAISFPIMLVASFFGVGLLGLYGIEAVCIAATVFVKG